MFSARSKIARTVGHAIDEGIDVKIWDDHGKLWAIAQCMRYAADNKVSAAQIREFAGAYLLSNAEFGYFVTTSSYTRHARRKARGYPWLRLWSGSDLLKYLEEVAVTMPAP